MTQPMTATSTVQAADCWTTFTNMCSTTLHALASGVAKIWNAIKAAVNYVYAAAAPHATRAIQWAKTNQQTAAIIAVVGATATAVGVYFFCCKNTTKVPVDPNQPPVKA